MNGIVHTTLVISVDSTATSEGIAGQAEVLSS